MKTGKWSIQKLIYTAMLAAVAGVLMSLEFSVPMMPPFYKVDFSDVPSVIAGTGIRYLCRSHQAVNQADYCRN